MTDEITAEPTVAKSDIPKRDQVKELIIKGGYTRDKIAKELNMSTASVSSQFTYLRWMGNFITFDDEKILSMVTEAEYNEWVAAKAAKAGTKKSAVASTKTPAEQYKALAKTIGVEKKQLTVWEAKLITINKDLAAMPEDSELLEMQAEASAMVVLLSIKVKRNERKLAAMPEPEEAPIDEDALPADDGADAVDVTDEPVNDDDII